MELRAVVFGGKFAGKTSLINAVFGKDLLPPKKRTAQCKKLQGSVCGRELTLVDTPGWWKDFPLSDTPEFLKQELIQGVSLCHPGPHVILLVIGIDTPFTEKYRKAVEDHLELLGGQIWTHTLVVFTRSHSLKDRTIEEQTEKGGEALQWVIERCSNRYHIFDSAASNNESQVRQLLEKIEDVVRRNNDTYFQIEAKILEEAAEWKKTVMTKASARELKLQEQMTQLNKEVSEMSLNPEHHGDEEVSQTEPETSDVGTVQDEDKSTLKLKDQFKEMLDREWSRREEVLLGRVQEMLSELRWEVQSEP
ncbi:hypothetical protein NFI96_007080, partial [Prochilodus magdalenae]